MPASSFVRITFVALALLSCAAVQARAPAATATAPRIAPTVQEKLGRNAPVEVIVLLDDSSEQAAEAAAFRGKPSLAGSSAGDYATRMTGRHSRLDALKHDVLGAAAGPDLETLREYTVLPVVHLRLRSPQALQRLEQQAKVLSVAEDHRNVAFLAESLPLIHQPAASAAGYGGTGATVAVLDTGVDYTRAAFGPCPVPGGSCPIAIARDFTPSDDGQRDANGHGTNVAGIVLGVAPNARVAALDVFRPDGYAYDSDILAAINWCTANKAAYNIAAINMSLGGGSYAAPRSPADAFGVGVQNAVNAGIVVIAASGNNGYASALSTPAAYSNVVSVGAVYDSYIGGVGYVNCSDATSAADRVTCFSNSASFLTLLAPGGSITAAGVTMFGTSQATPHVAGAVAVLRAAYPSESVASLVSRLKSGPAVVDARNGVSKPRLDLAQALGLSTSQFRLGAATYSVTEGAASVSIPVTRSNTAGTASVYFATENGTASAGADYTAASGTLNFAAGVATATLVVPILNDAVFESSETFTVTLNGPLGASLGTPSTATVTIVDNGMAAATLQWAAAAYGVGEGGGNVTLTVSRAGSTAGAASVPYSTASGSAASGTDFTARSGILSLAAGAVSATIAVPIINDTVYEGDEAFTVSLGTPTGATLGANRTASVKIVDNDVAASYAFSAVTYGVNEGAPAVTVTVTRANNLTGAGTVRYATANGTAVAGSDYAIASGTLSFAAGASKATLKVVIVNDKSKESKETFTVTLGSPAGGIVATPGTATVSVSDND